MAKKHFFNDLIPEGDFDFEHPGLGEKEGEPKNDGRASGAPAGVLPESLSDDGTSVVGGAGVNGVRKGRRKSAGRGASGTSGEGKAHLRISQRTHAKIKMYITFASLADGRNVIADEVVGRALDLLIERDCPNLLKNFK